MNDEGQWIILMGFIISVGIFFLAILLNQSVLVGQTTAESVLDFPKADIEDLKSEIWVIYSRYNGTDPISLGDSINDIQSISLNRKTATVLITPGPPQWEIHFNNGITDYTEEVKHDLVSGYDYFHY